MYVDDTKLHAGGESKESAKITKGIFGALKKELNIAKLELSTSGGQEDGKIKMEVFDGYLKVKKKQYFHEEELIMTVSTEYA